MLQESGVELVDAGIQRYIHLRLELSGVPMHLSLVYNCRGKSKYRSLLNFEKKNS